MVSVGLAFLLSVVAAFADVIGGAITVVRNLTERQIVWMTALGAGFLLGATLLDRLPDAMAGLPHTAPLLMMIGYLAMLLLQQFGGAHAHDVPSDRLNPPEPSDPSHSHSSYSSQSETAMTRQSALVTFLGLLVHTFMDGAMVAGSFEVNEGAGILMFIAITLHKIPEGFTMATISLAAGESRRIAFSTSLGLALSTVCGAALTLWAGSTDTFLLKIIMALATGTFIYISTTSLIPMVKDSGHTKAIYAIILGVILFYLSLVFVHSIGLM